MHTPEYTDQQLFDLFKSGNEQAFAVIFDRYRKRMFNEALFALKNESDAFDVVQEAFVTLWERKNRIIIKSSLQSYLIAIVRYNSLRVLESRAKKLKFISKYSIVNEMLISHWEKVEQESSQIIILQHVVSSVEKIKNPNRRLAFMKRYIQEKSLEEISNEMGYPKQTVQNWLSQAIKHIRQTFSNMSI